MFNTIFENSSDKSEFYFGTIPSISIEPTNDFMRFDVFKMTAEEVGQLMGGN